jgi:hypothetical protein
LNLENSGRPISTSEKIRTLAREGCGAAEIARQLGIRYQHAYNVMKADGAVSATVRSARSSPDTSLREIAPTKKAPLLVETLIAGGFEFSGQWIFDNYGMLTLDRPAPRVVGVYAFVKSGTALYIGVATMGLAKRLYYYGNPGATQRTSRRLNSVIKTELLSGQRIDLYTATPADLEWNGLPIHASAGLELGLIKKFNLPWNVRSAK